MKRYQFHQTIAKVNQTLKPKPYIIVVGDHIEIYPPYIYVTDSDEVEGIFCFMYCKYLLNNASAPSQVIDGICDYIRAELGLQSASWNPLHINNWDDGYEKTAFFFKYIENNHPGFVKALIEKIYQDSFNKQFIEDYTGFTVENLFAIYLVSLGFDQYPNIKVEIHGDLSIFEFTLTNLKEIVESTLLDLYSDPKDAPHYIKNINLYYEEMDGVAHCNDGKNGKEIHFSVGYISKFKDGNGLEAAKRELKGVLKHEMVHALQYNGKGTLPHGLVEGIADYIRLKAKLDPPHWKKTKGGSWKDGYSTSAYFLEWIVETQPDFVPELNLQLKKKIWTDIDFSTNIDSLWERYQLEFDKSA
ncbi:hypothetical protein HDV06_001388 [Boothiomyces sp. JEL0866]|nr:hypothetical protein HDV06_001388 [Boothiomyces sp. JEL0866]